MSVLFLGVIVFVGAHLFGMLVPSPRDRLKARLGEGRYKRIFSLVSLVGLGLMIYGLILAWDSPEAGEVLYYPPAWTRHAAMLLVLLAFIVIGASHGKGHMKLWLQQPMSIGIGLWAFAHLLTNGERPEVIFFAPFLGLALLDIVLSTLRGKVPHHEPRLSSDAKAVAIGVVLYLIFLFGFHPYVLNVPVA